MPGTRKKAQVASLEGMDQPGPAIKKKANIVSLENKENGEKKTIKPLQALILKASKNSSHHGDLLKKLTDMFSQMEPEEFFQQFVESISPFLGYAKKNSNVTFALSFVTKFICKCWEENASRPLDNDPLLQECCPFLYQLIGVLVQAPNYKLDTRFRICELLRRILENMSPDVNIEVGIWDEIEECLTECASDIYSSVRVQALYALKRLQDPRDLDCQVTALYIWHLQYDAREEVKIAAMNCIAPSQRVIKIMMESTREMNAEVAKTAFKYFISNFHIKALSIAQREELLKRGLHHENDSIVETVKEELLVSWLNLLNNDINELLQCLDAANCDTLAIEAVNALFNKEMSVNKLTDDFKLACAPNSESRLIPLEAITAEKAIYWYCICDYLHREKLMERLDEVLPDLPVLCKYIEKCVAKDFLSAEDDQIYWECLFTYLLKMLAFCDIVDVYGRQKCLDLSDFLLKNSRIEGVLLSPVMNILEKVIPDPTERIKSVLLIIADIKEPLPTSSDEPMEVLSEEEMRHKQFEIMKLSNQMHLLQDDIDDAVVTQNFVRAQVLKEEKDKIQEEKDRLQAAFDRHCALKASQENENAGQVMQPPTRIEEMEKCLDIVFELLQSPSITELKKHDKDGCLQRVMDTEIRCNIENPPTVRILKAAIRALGVCCIHDVESAQNYFTIFRKACDMDEDSITTISVKVIMDLVMLFGLEPFDLSDEDVLINTLLQYLYSVYEPLREATAVGFSKLLLFERIPSEDVLFQLLILWLKSSTDKDRVKQGLGVFFQAYASHKLENQLKLRNVFMKTMRQIHNDVLIHIDLEEAIKYFVYLTSEERLKDASISQSYPRRSTDKRKYEEEDCNSTKASSISSQDCPIHLLLAEEILKELNEAEAENHAYAKALSSSLNYLNLGTQFNGRFDQLKAELETILQKFEDNKAASKELRKWETRLDKLMKKRKDVDVSLVPEAPSSPKSDSILRSSGDVSDDSKITRNSDATVTNEENQPEQSA